METTLSVKPVAFQGEDEIIINAPIEKVWHHISDSKALEKWGPPVREVTVIDFPEKLGSRRIVVGEFTPSGAVITTEESAKVKLVIQPSLNPLDQIKPGLSGNSSTIQKVFSVIS